MSDHHITGRTVLFTIACLVIIVTGAVLSIQQTRVGNGLDELNRRSEENQVLRCADLRRAGAIAPETEGICRRSLGSVVGVTP